MSIAVEALLDQDSIHVYSLVNGILDHSIDNTLLLVNVLRLISCARFQQANK